MTSLSNHLNIIYILFIFIYACMCFSVCMSIHHVHTCCPRKLEEGIGSLRARVTNNYEPRWDCWELNQDPLEELAASVLNY